MKKALIVIDIQNDYFPAGRMALDGMEAAARNCQALLERFRTQKKPTFIIQHIFNSPTAPFFAPGSFGAEIHGSVAPTSQDKVIVKSAINCFHDTGLLQGLRQASVDNVVVCGAMSHMCIDAAVRAVADFGFQCTVADDGCATRGLEHRGVNVPAIQVHAAYMAALSHAYATVLSTREVLSALS